ncbi:MAG: SLBB domain-containing protein [Chitinispirillaceae bacterium]|nr:SLBB domain-containing protein [Chitinispirillaceae bacterium]
MKKYMYGGPVSLGAVLGLSVFINAQNLENYPDFSSKYKFSAMESIFKTDREPIEVSRSIPPSKLDNSIDENTYFVGGGDQFLISFLNRKSLTYLGSVNQEGDLYVPSLGLFKLGKIPLRDAKLKILKEVQKKSKTGDSLYITLHNAKNVTVYISGMVKSTGSYVFPGTMRLLDAVKFGSDKQFTLSSNLDDRTVRCSSGDTAVYYDLRKYMVSGDLSQNPYLYPGDQIAVRGITRRITVDGAISDMSRGMVPIKEGETVASALSVVELDASADTTSIILKRTAADRGETMITVPASSFTDQMIEDRDVLIVPVKKNHAEMFTVTVSGAVERPGMYPICKIGTTAEEILERAVCLPSASRNRIAVVRPAKALTLPYNLQEKNLMATTLPQTFTRSEMNNAISLMMTAKDFTVIRLKEQGAVPLENYDRIIVPKSEEVIYISGAVERPGGYTFIKGKSLSYYIGLAGGFTRLADRQNVYRVIKYDNIIQYSNSAEIEDGDIIVVPFSKENKFFINFVLPFFSMFATTVTLIVAIITIIPKNS